MENNQNPQPSSDQANQNQPLSPAEQKNQKIAGICCAVCCLVIIVGMGIMLAVLSGQAPGYESQSVVCPKFPDPVEKYSMEVPLVQLWTEKMKYNNIKPSVEVTQVCPSYREDFAFWVDGKFAGRTETDFWKFFERFDIKDCHGNVVFAGSTEDYLQTLKNSFKFQTSFQLYDKNNKPIAFIERTNLFNVEINLKDDENQLIARMTRTFMSWTWNVEIKNVTHPATNPYIIGVIIQKRGAERGRDTCNQLFWGSLWFFVTLAVLCLCVVCGAAGSICLKKRGANQESHERLEE